MDWSKEAATWPNSQHSRFVRSAPHHWHIQDLGTGPLVLLIHGAGGSTHSWQHLIAILAQKYRVVAVDLPGQGFTKLGAQHRCGLDPMADDLLALLKTDGLEPDAIIGHSAGVAIALRMAETMGKDAPHIIGINAALEPFSGLAGIFFPLIAKTIAVLPMAASLFSSATSNEQSVGKIIKGTGSNLPPDDLAFYRRLVASKRHVNATLQMMAQWKLEPLLNRLASNPASAFFIVGGKDTAVPPKTSETAAQRMKDARCVRLPDLGHLAHEEDAPSVANLILSDLKSREIV